MPQPALSPYAHGVIISIFNQAKEITCIQEIFYHNKTPDTYIRSALRTVSLHDIVLAAGFLVEPPQEALPNLAKTLEDLHKSGLIGAEKETFVRRLIGNSPLKCFAKVAKTFANRYGHAFRPDLEKEFAADLALMHPDLAQQQFYIIERGKFYCHNRQAARMRYRKPRAPRGTA